jgi:N-acetylmuramoyl-L-alanine amidase
MGVKQNSAVLRSCKRLISNAFISILIAMLVSSWPCAAGSDRLAAPKAIVALDPGHGGNDPGGRGPGGTFEKDINLALTRRITLEMEPEFKILLTRSEDYTLPLPERTAIANHHKADLLISIHTASGFLHATQGINIYSLQPPKAPPEGSIPTGPTAWERAQLPYADAGKALAQSLSRSLAAIPDPPEVRLMQAPLSALKGAQMPAVLIEIGYLTNPATETSLNSEARQAAYARAIAQGIESYMITQRRGP